MSEGTGGSLRLRVNPTEQGFAQSPPRPAQHESPAKHQMKRELTPLIISFAADKCIYPPTLSTLRERRAEISLFVFAGEPLMSQTIFEKRYQEFLRERQEWIRQRPQRERARYA